MVWFVCHGPVFREPSISDHSSPMPSTSFWWLGLSSRRPSKGPPLPLLLLDWIFRLELFGFPAYFLLTSKKLSFSLGEQHPSSTPQPSAPRAARQTPAPGASRTPRCCRRWRCSRASRSSPGAEPRHPRGAEGGGRRSPLLAR